MKIISQVFFIAVFAVILLSCKQNRLKVDISGSAKDVEFVRFEEELFSLPFQDTLNEFLALRGKNSDFFDLFTYKVIHVGGIDDKQFTPGFSRFIADTMIRNVKKLVIVEYSDFNKTEKEINKAFKYFQYHFPKKEIPTVFTFISGFNQSIITAEGVLGIGLDKYLGQNCSYYQRLATTPQYKIANMHKKKIVSDVAMAWAITTFEHTNKATNVLGNMVQKGKLMYFVDALLPELHDTLKIGYSAKQLEWCKNNERQMWTYLVEKKMLYSSNRMDIIRYINDAPYTSSFPIESPGRTGVWLGWQIVRQYMESHPETTLNELMNNSDYQGILNASGYFPE